MGIKPVPLSYPAEWLLDIFNAQPGVRRPRPYVFEIQTPPTPWVLDYGWHVIGGTILVGALLIGLHLRRIL